MRILVYVIIIVVFAGCANAAIIDRVIDGDTMVIDGERVRLAGLDCEEITTTKGRVIADSVKGLTGMRVTLERTGTDKYQRTLGIVRVNGKSLNAKLLDFGMCRRWY